MPQTTTRAPRDDEPVTITMPATLFQAAYDAMFSLANAEDRPRSASYNRYVADLDAAMRTFAPRLFAQSRVDAAE